MTRHFFFFAGSLTLVAFVACSSSNTDTTNAGDGGASSTSSGGASSSGTTSSSGASGDGGGNAIAQAIFQVNGGAAADCATVPAFAVGSFESTPPTPVPNGTKEDGSTITVQCRVIPDANGFELFAHIDQAGTSVELSGTIDATGKTKPGTMLLVGSDTWTSTDCEFTPNGAQQGVAAGRYWATISCPQADSKDGNKCDLFGQVRIENCDASRE